MSSSGRGKDTAPRKMPSHRVSNAVILKDDNEAERNQTWGELFLSMSKARQLWSSRRRLFFLPNGDLFHTVRMCQHLDLRLADPEPTGHDFYLVSRPRVMEGPLGSTHHWSVYCQGHFFHLTAPALPRQSVAKSKTASLFKDVACRLRHEDLSNPDTQDQRRVATSSRGTKALIAYKVGQTDYCPEQVSRLAQYVVSRLPVYNLFTANCQDFAAGMVGRTVMRLGDRSVFVGTAIQIVEWDLNKAGDQPHVNSAERGFVIQQPLPG